MAALACVGDGDGVRADRLEAMRHPRLPTSVLRVRDGAAASAVA